MKKYFIVLGLFVLLSVSPFSTQAFSLGDISSAVVQLKSLVAELRQLQLGAVNTAKVGEWVTLSDFSYTPNSPVEINTPMRVNLKVTNSGTVNLPAGYWLIGLDNSTSPAGILKTYQLGALAIGSSIEVQTTNFSYSTKGKKPVVWLVKKGASADSLVVSDVYSKPIIVGENANLLVGDFTPASPVLPNTNVVANIGIVNNGVALSGYQLVATNSSGLVVPVVDNINMIAGEARNFSTPAFDSGVVGTKNISWKLQKGTSVVGNIVSRNLVVGDSTPVVVTFPVAGAVLVEGSTYDITWTGCGDNHVRSIFLVKKSTGDNYQLGNVYPLRGDNKFNWTITPELFLEGNDYFIQLKCSGIIVDSGLFSIVPPSITVVYPNGGENLVVGQKYNITWKTKDFGNLNVDLSLVACRDDLCSIAVPFIATNYPNTGSYLWTIKKGYSFVRENKYKIYASPTMFGKETGDYSDDFFSIFSLPTAIITQPKGGTFFPGQRVTVKYTTVGFSSNTKVHLQLNKGAIYPNGPFNGVKVSPQVPATGVYTFTIPANAVPRDDYSFMIVPEKGYHGYSNVFKVAFADTVDLGFGTITKNSSTPTFDINFCMNGPVSLADAGLGAFVFKASTYAITDDMFGYTKESSSYSTAMGGAEVVSLKNGACTKWSGLRLTPDMITEFNQNGKIKFEILPLANGVKDSFFKNNYHSFYIPAVFSRPDFIPAEWPLREKKMVSWIAFGCAPAIPFVSIYICNPSNQNSCSRLKSDGRTPARFGCFNVHDDGRPITGNGKFSEPITLPSDILTNPLTTPYISNNVTLIKICQSEYDESEFDKICATKLVTIKK